MYENLPNAYRLIYPARFSTERQARWFATNNRLAFQGITPVEVPDDQRRGRPYWILAIDSDLALMMAEGLRTKYPHITWIVQRRPESLEEAS